LTGLKWFSASDKLQPSLSIVQPEKESGELLANFVEEVAKGNNAGKWLKPAARVADSIEFHSGSARISTTLERG
jgi:hypothetical protein